MKLCPRCGKRPNKRTLFGHVCDSRVPVRARRPILLTPWSGPPARRRSRDVGANRARRLRQLCARYTLVP